MVLLIIIPMKNGYFIGNINPTFSDKPMFEIDDANFGQGANQALNPVTGRWTLVRNQRRSALHLWNKCS